MLNRHFSIYLAAYVLPAAVGFFAITAYTRLLSPAEYGLYVVGMSSDAQDRQLPSRPGKFQGSHQPAINTSFGAPLKLLGFRQGISPRSIMSSRI